MCSIRRLLNTKISVPSCYNRSLPKPTFCFKVYFVFGGEAGENFFVPKYVEWGFDFLSASWALVHCWSG